MITLTAALLLLQTPSVAPILIPMGASPSFHEAAAAVQAAVDRGDAPGVQAALRLLPKRQVAVRWDDANVPAASKGDFNRERDLGIKTWTIALVRTQFTFARERPDIAFSFDQGPGLKLTWSVDPGQPRLSAVIGLKPTTGPLDPAAVCNRVEAALGAYLGVPELPFAGFVMSRGAEGGSQEMRVSSFETAFAIRSTATADQIREAIQAGRRVSIQSGKVAKTPDPIKLGPVFQGKAADFEVDVTNSGTGPLEYHLVPDCGCIATVKVAQLPAGKTGTAKGRMDTIDFSGTVIKHLYLISNDPVDPVRLIPMEVSITPRYGFSPPSGQFVIAPESGSPTVTAYFYSPEDHPLQIVSVTTEGIPAEATFEPWSGALPDSNQTRKGYKLTLTPKDIPDGARMGANLVITTDDPDFQTIKYLVNFQKGIVAFPSSVFLGEIGSAPRQAVVTLSRPGKPFKITGVTSTSAHLSGRAEPKANGDQQVVIQYDGKAETGDYAATVFVATDDPRQPKIEIAISATVR